MDANEALNSFDLDPRLFYDAISYSTDDYLYIIDMKTDMALVSENMQQDFDLPGRVFEGLIPRWRELIADRDRQSFDESIDDMLCGKTDELDLEKAMEFCAEDECVEVTPEIVRVRKVELTASLRMRAKARAKQQSQS